MKCSLKYPLPIFVALTLAFYKYDCAKRTPTLMRRPNYSIQRNSIESSSYLNVVASACSSVERVGDTDICTDELLFNRCVVYTSRLLNETFATHMSSRGCKIDFLNTELPGTRRKEFSLGNTTLASHYGKPSLSNEFRPLRNQYWRAESISSRFDDARPNR